MKRGITATSVVIMVLVIAILLGTITTFSYNSIENAKKITFSLEISNLQETVNRYIDEDEEGESPMFGDEYVINLSAVSSSSISQFDDEVKNENNEITVYELDLSALGITDTVYGNKKTEKDVYVVSKTTGRVYYLEGIKSKKKTYYTLTEELMDLKDKKETNNEVSYNTPVISSDGFVTKTLSDGSKEVYLSNINVENNPKIFKYEIGIITEDIAKEYFKNNGKTVLGNKLKFDDVYDITLYAENEIGEYNVLYCTKEYGLLQVNAKDVLDKGIKIGDSVTGYALDSNSTLYTTSGRENTAPDGGSNVEQVDTRQLNLQRIEYTTWKYIGIGKNGEVLIAPDMVTSSVTTAQKMKLSGKGGYLNGPKELNDMCKALYSTDKGIARSMNIDDINRILEYTGSKGVYSDENSELVGTPEAKKLSELGITTGCAPIGDISDYYSDWYSILNNSTDILRSLDPENNEDMAKKELLLNFVYTDNEYWLSSNCAFADLHDSCTYFRVRVVTTDNVYAHGVFNSINYSNYFVYAIRPVICIKPNIKLNKQDNGTWVLS